MEMLRRFGPEAAPAIPALVKNLESGDAYFARSAADALHAIGPASWPLVLDILEHGSPETRAALLGSISVRLEQEGRDTSEAVAALAVAAVVKALDDPAFEVRSAAAEGIGSCLMRTKDSTRYDSAIPVLFRIVSDRAQIPPAQAIYALSSFGDKAAFAIPSLVELLDARDVMVRICAATCLPLVDKPGKQSAAALRKMFHDADADCRKAAAIALGELGLSPDEDTTSAKR
jgi:HEAT repeat protein